MTDNGGEVVDKGVRSCLPTRVVPDAATNCDEKDAGSWVLSAGVERWMIILLYIDVALVFAQFLPSWVHEDISEFRGGYFSKFGMFVLSPILACYVWIRILASDDDNSTKSCSHDVKKATDDAVTNCASKQSSPATKNRYLFLGNLNGVSLLLALMIGTIWSSSKFVLSSLVVFLMIASVVALLSAKSLDASDEMNNKTETRACAGMCYFTSTTRKTASRISKILFYVALTAIAADGMYGASITELYQTLIVFVHMYAILGFVPVVF